MLTTVVTFFIGLLAFFLGYYLGHDHQAKKDLASQYFLMRWLTNEEVILLRGKVAYDPAIKQWIASCKNLGIVTQGESKEHAQDMLVEALEEVILDDLRHGLDPMDRAKSQERVCH